MQEGSIYIDTRPDKFYEEAGKLFREPVVVDWYAVSPAYCGTVPNRYGQAVDYHSTAYYLLVADHGKLLEAVREADTRLLEEIARDYEELHRRIEAHTDTCSTWDCENTRNRWAMEVAGRALEKLGVPHATVHASFCGEEARPEEFEEKLSETYMDIEELVEEELCRRNQCGED